jgi:hypothetical protein
MAMKKYYADWPEPIDWHIYSTFFMEFVDLSLHLPDEDYAVLERFRKGRVMVCGTVQQGDPLLHYRTQSSLAAVFPMDGCQKSILRVRDDFERSAAWDPIDVDDSGLKQVRQILLQSTTEFATMVQEWQFYVLSIGRDTYIETPKAVSDMMNARLAKMLHEEVEKKG